MIVNELNRGYVIPTRYNNRYIVSFLIESNSDKYSITVNGDEVPYNSRESIYDVVSAGSMYPTEFTVIISEKEN